MLKLIDELVHSSIFSVFVGAFLTFIFGFLLSKRSHNYAYEEKIAIKRIEAYEDIIKVMRELNHFLDFEDDEIPESCAIRKSSNFGLSIPGIFMSEKGFLKFMNDFMHVFSTNRLWIDNDVAVEMEWIRDYLGAAWDVIHKRTDYDIKIIGVIISDEIAQNYGRLEDTIKTSIKKKTLNLRHIKKYDLNIKERSKRYKDTMLYRYFINESDWLGEFEFCRSCTTISEKNMCPVKDIKGL